MLNLIRRCTNGILLSVFISITARRIVQHRSRIILNSANGLRTALNLNTRSNTRVGQKNRTLRLNDPIMRRQHKTCRRHKLNIPHLRTRRGIHSRLRHFTRARVVNRGTTGTRVLRQTRPLMTISLVTTRYNLRQSQRHGIRLTRHIRTLSNARRHDITVNLRH